MNKSLLSISSHVVHGYVGNRAMVFPLQYTGWDVDALNTTNYSNHPGYGSFSGTASSAELVSDILAGLSKILKFNHYDIILTGYTPNADVLEVVKNEILNIMHGPEKPKWIVDPVLGDNGRLYVSEKVIPVYKDIFASGHVSLTTPNQFEFETLSGVKVTSWDSIKEAVNRFNELYKVDNLVISSIHIDEELYCVSYSKESGKTFYIPIRQIPCNFNGSGDLFTAILANSYYDNEYRITPEVISDTVTKLHKILDFSYQDELNQTNNQDKEVTLVKDIRVIAAKDVLLENHTLELIEEVVYL
ncbi:BUD17 [[Candida] subhashii]|uniref:BUD17 n=1 Tax=[Candida] subhashii TaxID=561895 RepID=A0A8J5QDT2_9ASCO|nr:BUD17 [[Candida] subhashii]KAG7660823.1 BUD17 [[Candida] subhashii]